MNVQKSNCLFCQIVDKKIDSYLLIENKQALAILDAFPMSPGHVLVLPKKHFQYLHQIEQESLKSAMMLLQKITQILYEIGGQDYNVLNNNGAIAGQSVFHLHWHVLPRLADDEVLSFKHGQKKEVAYYQKWQKKIIDFNQSSPADNLK